MRNLTDAIHALGLEIGMYVTGGFEAVYGQEAAWARAVFTEWNFDGIKIDHMCGVPACNVPGARTSNIAAPFQGPTMARWAAAIAAENATRRALVQNCGVGCSPAMGPNSSTPTPWGDFCAATANMWRTSGDIAAMWGPLLSTNAASLIGRGSYAGPGGWNYPDSLEIGNARKGVKLTPAQSRAHFSLWCVTSSPLYLGMNLSAISADDLAIVANRDAIAVNQAWAGYAGDMLNFSQFPPADPAVVNVSVIPTTSVWWKPLPNSSAAAVLLNKGGAPAQIGFAFRELQWAGAPSVPPAGACDVFSVWDGKSLGQAAARFDAQVEGDSALFVVLSGCAAAPAAAAPRVVAQ
jgi:alpha-galactosidase